MADITIHQIEQISGDIDRQGLTYVELKDEILDHICCQVELEMAQGMMFNDAYRKVREAMGIKRIRKLQDETLNLISKKYRRMKRMMYVLGVAAPLLVIVAAVLKIYHWPGGSLVMSLALFVTGMLFLPVLVMSRIRDTRRMDEPVPMGMYITGMIAGMITILGALFKIQHFPASGILLTLGLSSLALVFLPVYAVAKIREARTNGTEINRRLLLGGIFAGALLVIGVLFKIMHWPGAGIVILVSWSAVAVLFIPLLVMNQLKESRNSVNNFFNILLVTTATAVFIMALIRSAPRDVISGFLLPEKHLSCTAQLLDERNAVMVKNLSDSREDWGRLEALVHKSEEISAYIAQVRKDLSADLSFEEDPAVDSEGRVDLSKVGYIEDKGGTFHRIREVDDLKLYHLLESFREEALRLTDDALLENYISTQLGPVPLPANKKPRSVEAGEDPGEAGEDPGEAWARYYFSGTFLQSAAVLGMFESAVQLITYDLLNALQVHPLAGNQKPSSSSMYS